MSKIKQEIHEYIKYNNHAESITTIFFINYMIQVIRQTKRRASQAEGKQRNLAPLHPRRRHLTTILYNYLIVNCQRDSGAITFSGRLA